MPKIHNIRKQENQYEVTHVSPSCVKNGVLGVSIIQLRRGSDKKNLTEISTLTSEVVSSDKPYFFNRSLVHSSARDQLRNYDQFGLISRNTLLWVQNLPYFYQNLLGFPEIF